MYNNNLFSVRCYVLQNFAVYTLNSRVKPFSAWYRYILRKHLSLAKLEKPLAKSNKFNITNYQDFAQGLPLLVLELPVFGRAAS